MMKSNKQKTLFILSFMLVGLIFASTIIASTAGKNNSLQNGFLYPNDDETTIQEDEDEDDDKIDDKEEELNERKLQIEVETNEITVESELKNGDQKNEFKVEIKTEDDGLRVKFGYSTEIDQIENEFEFKVVFNEIIEYEDLDENLIYNESIDNDLQVYEIAEFAPIDYVFENKTDGELHIFTITTEDDVFSAVVYMSNEFLIVNDTLVAPTEVKIDLKITNYDYLDDNSRLALKVKMEAEHEIEYEHETEDEQHARAENETEIKIKTTDYQGFFSWVETAMVDGIERPVYTNQYDIHDYEQKIFLNYYHGDEIIHDPKIGIANVLISPETTLNLSVSIMTIGGIISFSILAIAIVGIMKINRKKNA
ncbi:MAG: hypothetical protein ACFFDW_13960 [Candidatus Thorarchaeota archaeon]